MKTRLRRLAPVVIGAFLLAPTTAAGQESRSAASARELAKLLDEAQLDAIAARDPARPDHFVAALYFQGSQILVVSARYAAPSLLAEKIAKKEYRDVYVDLNSAFVPNSKVFVEDLSVDGLRAKPEDEQPHDTWENGPTRLAFDGDWKKQKLSESDYLKAFGDADQKYAQVIAILLGSLKKSSD